MATLRAHPTPFARYLAHGGLCVVCPDGVTLIRKLHSGWKVYRRRSKRVPLEQWRLNKERKLAELRELEPWRFAAAKLPSLRQLETMQYDGPITTPTGAVVEDPCLSAPDGSPSWIKFLGYA